MASHALTWTAYLFMACQGYLLYAVGFITPYLQSDLGVPPWLAALPNSMMALGILSAGLVAKRVAARIGPRRAARVSAGLMALAGVLLATPITILPILLGAFLFGVAVAGMLVHVVSAIGGREGGKLLARAYLWAMVAAIAAPLALSAASRSVGWAVGPLVPVPLLALLVFILPASPARDRAADAGSREPGLSRAYWLTWIFLVLCMGAEFSIVAWGAQVATARTGLGAADATGLASFYVFGMVLGRLGLSGGFGSGTRRVPVLRASASLSLIGSVVLWAAPTPALAGAGLLLAGLGMSGVMPLGSTLALAHAADAPIRASARLTAAMGVAVLAAPLVLGIASVETGVVGAWPLVFAFLGAGLLVLTRIPRPSPPGPGVAPPPTSPAIA
jgi:MFS family permease